MNNKTTTLLQTYMVIKTIINHTINIFCNNDNDDNSNNNNNKKNKNKNNDNNNNNNKSNNNKNSNLQDIMNMMDVKLAMENAKWCV